VPRQGDAVKITDIAEIAWRTRCFLEQHGRRRAETAAIRDIDVLVTDCLRNLGHDPGKTAEDADNLKLELLRSGDDTDSGRDSVARCLEEVARLDNSDATPHRTVGRWAEFVNRAVFGPTILKDDPVLPVYPWVKARKIDTGDYVVMAKAFVEWTREANEAFAERRGAK